MPTARRPSVSPALAAATAELAGRCKLLADPARLSILATLARHGEVHVSALCDALGQTQPAISHHLQLLRVAGLVVDRREGKYVWYSVNERLAADLVAALGEALGLVVGRTVASQ